MDIQARLRARVFEVVNEARKLYPSYAAAPYPEIRFYTKGRVMGTAKGGCILRLNLTLAEQNMDEALNDTIPHEVAHLVCQVDPTQGKGHNYGWRWVCQSLGGSGRRTYCPTGFTPKVIKKTVRQYRYVAACGTEIWLGAGRHSKIIKRGKTYRLRRTGGQIASTHYTGDSRIKS